MLWNKRKTSADPFAAGSDTPDVRFGPGGHAEEDDLHYCLRRIAEEEGLARSAGSWEAGLVHDQTAMLYLAQLAALRRQARAGDDATCAAA